MSILVRVLKRDVERDIIEFSDSRRQRQAEIDFPHVRALFVTSLFLINLDIRVHLCGPLEIFNVYENKKLSKKCL